MIEICGVTKRFGACTALDGVHLTVARGEAVALWGDNGAGKTTLIRCVAGLLAFEGTIAVGGFDVRRQGKQARRLIGYVPQDLGFHEEMPAGEAVRWFGSMRGVRVRVVDDVLGPVGLAGHGGKRMRELSGGMKQRLALAIALVGSPPVLLLDEVTASLDRAGRGHFLHLLQGMAGGGRTLLFASHREDEVRLLATRCVQLEHGRTMAAAAASRLPPLEVPCTP